MRQTAHPLRGEHRRQRNVFRTDLELACQLPKQPLIKRFGRPNPGGSRTLGRHPGESSNNRRKVDFDSPLADYYAEHKNAALTLHFTLPFKTPVKAKEPSEPVLAVDTTLWAPSRRSTVHPARPDSAPSRRPSPCTS